MNLLQDKVVVITGGAGLLGRKFCAAVSEQGGVAIVADMNATAASETVHVIEATGGRAIPKHLDITSLESITRLIQELHDEHGVIHAVVNNAYPKSRNYGRKFEAVSYEDMCEGLSKHLGGYFQVSQQFAEYFKHRGGGNIVNMGSIYGTIAPRFSVYDETPMTMPVEYALIKAGVAQLTRYVAQYYKGAGIRCNMLSPGGIADGQPESFLERYKNLCAGKGMLDAEDISGALIFLLSDASKHLLGQNLVVDDGFSL
ncbi:MAG: SDR family oxidoreductase [Oxalobacter sp.]|nr:MAG: SDR family oxidoreductase [Oxalobacter sp.]